MIRWCSLILALTSTAVMAPWKIVAERSWEPTAGPLGIAFLTDYLLPFEVASVVLLAVLSSWEGS